MPDEPLVNGAPLPPPSDAAHLLANTVHFVHTLRVAGLPVSTAQTLAFVQAMELVGLEQREHVYHAGRALLVSRKEDLAVYDFIFGRFWRAGAGTSAVRARHERPSAQEPRPARGSFTVANYDDFRSWESAREIDIEDRRGTWSNLEVLRTKRFAAMSPEELDALRRLIRDTPWSASLRRTRRLVTSPHGRMLDMRRAMRRALRHGGLVVTPPRRTAKIKERPIVFLADISGSMDRYSRLALQFLHAALRSRRNVECFVFGTRLTRLTPQLRIRNVDRAVDSAAAAVTDWAGGTRIGDSLRDFNRRWSRRVLRRGAIAVVLSDGLDRGDLTTLRREMRWLRDRAWRVIWLNPLAGSAGFSPTAEGMAAALEFIDDFLPAHNLRSLEGFVASLRSLPRRRAVRRSRGYDAPGAAGAHAPAHRSPPV